ncbi:hypothetical protein [Arundinibacter roseus]|uniref:Uncharacterized protein n=1 Tax=Arundinibacter roseus TaxID=2070510 RepID=A0A4R4KGC2_9BACT|nr:hypothetical protein [Arundinibacter roseus]TDB67084.1 hypothetical protein EZE20_08195 [Arundinibacter roseus]
MLSTGIIKKKKEGFEKWLVLINPGSHHKSVLILRGHYPQYIFEIVAPTSDPDHYKVDFKGDIYFIKVRRDFDKKGEPPVSYMRELLQWYHKTRLTPRLSDINKPNSTT